MEGKVVIHMGAMTIEVPRKEISEIVETPEGVNFHFVGGSYFSYTNQYLPSELKQKIKLISDKFLGGKVTINFNDLSKIISVDMN